MNLKYLKLYTHLLMLLLETFHFKILRDLVQVILLSTVLPCLAYTPLPSVTILRRKALGRAALFKCIA